MEPASPVTPAAAAPPAPVRRTDHSGTCLIFGTLLALAGLIGPRVPGYLTGQTGIRYSVASYHAVCTSGFGELAQSARAVIAGQCSQADLLLAAGWAAAGAGALLLLAGILLRTRRPAA